MFFGLRVDSLRYLALALGLIALSVTLQWLSALVFADPARPQAVVEYLYAERGAVQQTLNVMALALLTIGLLRTGFAGSAGVCAGWIVTACLIEAAQHPVFVDSLLTWSRQSSLPSHTLDAGIALFLNGQFAWSDIAASFIGGAAALAVAGRPSRIT
ncbi:MAG TPA: hypothetical protein VFO82_17065 [Steroidobacteraceae bacterium]|nr:hypothetical protein [Steroidobacteraceae bacterium]